MKNTDELTPEKYGTHFDFAELKKRYGVEKRILVKILSLANKTITSSMIEMERYVKDKNIRSIHSIAHKIKGTAITICCYDLSKLASNLETSSELDPKKIDLLVQGIEEEVLLVQKILTKELKNLENA